MPLPTPSAAPARTPCPSPPPLPPPPSALPSSSAHLAASLMISRRHLASTSCRAHSRSIIPQHVAVDPPYRYPRSRQIRVLFVFVFARFPSPASPWQPSCSYSACRNSAENHLWAAATPPAAHVSPSLACGASPPSTAAATAAPAGAHSLPASAAGVACVCVRARGGERGVEGGGRTRACARAWGGLLVLTFIPTCLPKCVHAYTDKHTHAHTWIHTLIHPHPQTHACRHACIRTHKCMQAHT